MRHKYIFILFTRLLFASAGSWVGHQHKSHPDWLSYSWLCWRQLKHLLLIITKSRLQASKIWHYAKKEEGIWAGSTCTQIWWLFNIFFTILRTWGKNGPRNFFVRFPTLSICICNRINGHGLEINCFEDFFVSLPPKKFAETRNNDETKDLVGLVRESLKFLAGEQ